ncbi:MAG: sigma-54-dependent Fis family transcriptional regulator [Betaproteobacteria bacterium]|nr:sigma-54-dependent Fis family transcriptional regulator [Betaproteobacteria bacterium]
MSRLPNAADAAAATASADDADADADAAPPEAADAHAPASDAAGYWPDAAVLVVDDEPGMRHFLVKTLAPRAGRVFEAGSAEEAEALLARHRFDLLILDITLPGKSGIQLLKQLHAEGHPGEVILITAFADLDTAIEALRAGAGDFLLKPFRVTQVLNAFRHGLERARLKRENWLLRRALSQRTPPADGLVGRSIVIKGLQAALQRMAAVDSTVLLTGESGTGKELAALALHRLSAMRRTPGDGSRGPFVPLNCAAASPQTLDVELFGQPGHDGLFVYAQGGTLFLDEVAELPLPLQAALLRVLESRRVRPVGSEQEIPVSARIVAATSRPLRAEVEAGRFRPELFYRLQVVEITLPPLRAHKEDIPDLVAHFVGTLAPRLGVPPIEVSEAEMQFLQQYDWPGNVRELRNVIERSLIVGALNVSALYQELARLEAAGSPPAPPASAGAADAEPVDLATLEKRHILAVLESVAGDKSRAARLLGISRRTLERRVADWAGG